MQLLVSKYDSHANPRNRASVSRLTSQLQSFLVGILDVRWPFYKKKPGLWASRVRTRDTTACIT